MSLQSWTDLTTTPLPQALTAASSIVSADGYVFVMGGETYNINVGTYGVISTVYSAKIDKDGFLSTWMELKSTPLPKNIAYASAVISADGYIYLIGGYSGAGPTFNSVYSAKIIPGTGTIEAWQDLTATPLPQALIAASAILSADGYIYIMGGKTFNGDNNINVTTVYSAKIIPGGMLTTWTELTASPLPQALTAASSIVSDDGYIYLMGGEHENAAQATVYSAKIIPGGTLTTWTDLTATPLPQALTAASSIVSAGGYIYIMGGQSGEGQPNSFNSVYSAKIIPETGTIESWKDLTATPLPQALTAASSIVSAGGYIYIIGGTILIFDITTDVTTIVSTVYSTKIITPTPGPPIPIIPSNICFPAGTLIRTDQGEVAIEKLQPGKHTLNRKTITHITQTVSMDKYLVQVRKDAFGKNKPTKSMVMSKDHKIEFQGELVPVYRFLDYLEDVTRVKYSGEILYNVLLAEYGTMSVNNLRCETLEPTSLIACMYRDVVYKKEKVENRRFKI